MTTYAFTKENVDWAPLQNGVYRLFDGYLLIYVGSASGLTGTIRNRLQRHFNGDEGRCTQSATSFDFIVTEYPLSTEGDLLKAYRDTYGRLPRCNERLP